MHSSSIVPVTLTTSEHQIKNNLLLDDVVHFHDVLLLQTAAKVQYRIYGLNNLDLLTQGTTEFITLRPLVVPSLRSGAKAQGLQVINSVDPCVLKSNYYFKFKK